MELRRHKKMISILSIMIITSIIMYFYARVFHKAYISNIPLTLEAATSISTRSATSLFAMIVSAVLIAIVSQVFQTITSNRVITPSMIGFDSIFIASQAIIILFSDKFRVLHSNPYLNFLFSSVLMVSVSVLMYVAILRKNRNNLYLLLLLGIIISSIVRSITNYIEVILKPQEFQSLKAATSVTITNMNTKIIYLAAFIMIIVMYKLIKSRHELDVMLLNQDNATSLGVDYNQRLKVYLMYISIAMSVTTALIGPITFLGLIAVNISKEITKDYRHSVIFITSSMIAVFLLVFGQSIVELLRYSTPVTVLINLIGGIYMIYLIIKENIV